jgi:dUTP pyrophosphatase
MKMHPDAIKPTRAHAFDAGLDLHSIEDISLKPGVISKIKTGIAIDLTPDLPFEREEGDFAAVGLIMGKSGLGAKGIIILGGVIDEEYRGELVVMATSLVNEVFLRKGSKVAQLVVTNISCPTLEESPSDFLDETARGTSGFGSTGE